MVQFAAAVSEHPTPAQATGEVIGQIIEQLGAEPDLAVLFVSRSHTGATEDIVHAVQNVVRPASLIGATAGAVVGGGREIEDAPAISLWAGRLGACTPVRMVTEPGADGMVVVGIPDDLGEARVMVTLTDPFTFDTDSLIEAARERHPGLRLIGGMASAANRPGGNRLVLDGSIHDHGAVGVLLPPSVTVSTVVSQGCRPVGEPFVVTRSERQIVHELGGMPALERLRSMVEDMPDDDRRLLAQGIHVGRVIDEHKTRFERGDFLIRSVLGGDEKLGAIAVGDEVPVGATLQFQVRDADTADEDLRALMATQRGEAALVFTCNGRGTHLFGEPDHDASIVAAANPVVAGMFCAGELGPVGGANFIHGFTASVLVFGAG